MPKHYTYGPSAADRIIACPGSVGLSKGIKDESSDNVYGTLEGVYYPTPYVPSTGLLTDLDVIVTTDVTAVTFRDVTRPGAGTLVAMALMGDV